MLKRNGDAHTRWHTISAHAVLEEKRLLLQMKILKKNHTRECHCYSAVGVVPHQSLHMSFSVNLGKKITQASDHLKVLS